MAKKTTNDHLKRKKFRDIPKGPECVVTSCCFDPVSALTAEEIGFDNGLLGGSIASMSMLRAPDWQVLQLGELVEQVRRICRVDILPLLVDGDNGCGSALSAMRCIRELAAAGAAAVMIEDTVLPSPTARAERMR